VEGPAVGRDAEGFRFLEDWYGVEGSYPPRKDDINKIVDTVSVKNTHRARLHRTTLLKGQVT
jgi:hypothetical protein